MIKFPVTDTKFKILNSINILESTRQKPILTLISKHSGFTSLTVSSNLKELESDGFVCSNPKNRVRYCYITEFGKKLIELCKEILLLCQKKEP